CAFEFGYLEKFSCFGRYPWACFGRLELLLYLNPSYKIKIDRRLNCQVYLLQSIFIFGYPYGSLKGKVLWAIWIDIYSITIVRANIHAIHKLVVIIYFPTISNRRHKFLFDNCHPVFIKVILLKRGTYKLRH